MEITGTICAIYPVREVSPSFRTRDFVLDISEEYHGVLYTGYAVMQAKNATCDYLQDVHNGDTIKFVVGDRVSVTFGLKGYKQKGGDNFYNQLSVYKIVAAEQEYAAYAGPAAPTPGAPPPPVSGNGVTGFAGYQPTAQQVPRYEPMAPPPETIDDLPF